MGPISGQATPRLLVLLDHIYELLSNFRSKIICLDITLADPPACNNKSSTFTAKNYPKQRLLAI